MDEPSEMESHQQAQLAEGGEGRNLDQSRKQAAFCSSCEQYARTLDKFMPAHMRKTLQWNRKCRNKAGEVCSVVICFDQINLFQCHGTKHSMKLPLHVFRFEGDWS